VNASDHNLLEPQVQQIVEVGLPSWRARGAENT
jgi:hypothetical protein